MFDVLNDAHDGLPGRVPAAGRGPGRCSGRGGAAGRDREQDGGQNDRQQRGQADAPRDATE